MYHFNYFLRYIQNSLIQASFWHDPLQKDEYQKKNLFLADINNENTNNTVNILKLLIWLKCEYVPRNIIMSKYIESYHD